MQYVQADIVMYPPHHHVISEWLCCVIILFMLLYYSENLLSPSPQMLFRQSSGASSIDLDDPRITKFTRVCVLYGA